MDMVAMIVEADPAHDNSECRTVTLKQDINFNACTFEEDVSFSGPWENTQSLSVTFEGDVLFNLSVFLGQARFIGEHSKRLPDLTAALSITYALFAKRYFITAHFFGR